MRKPYLATAAHSFSDIQFASQEATNAIGSQVSDHFSISAYSRSKHKHFFRNHSNIDFLGATYGAHGGGRHFHVSDTAIRRTPVRRPEADRGLAGKWRDLYATLRIALQDLPALERRSHSLTDEWSRLRSGVAGSLIVADRLPPISSLGLFTAPMESVADGVSEGTSDALQQQCFVAVVASPRNSFT